MKKKNLKIERLKKGTKKRQPWLLVWCRQKVGDEIELRGLVWFFFLFISSCYITTSNSWSLGVVGGFHFSILFPISIFVLFQFYRLGKGYWEGHVPVPLHCTNHHRFSAVRICIPCNSGLLISPCSTHSCHTSCIFTYAHQRSQNISFMPWSP